MPPFIAYVGVFLDEESKKKLLELVPPQHGAVHADHVTVKFKPTPMMIEQLTQGWPFAYGELPEQIKILTLGAVVRLRAVAAVHDAKGQAVLVEGCPSDNEHTHITISCAPDTKPVYSNQLLKEGTLQYFATPIELTGTLDTFPPQKLLKEQPNQNQEVK